MQEKINRITSLIEKFLEEEKLTVQEEKELNEWLAEAEHNGIFFQQITDKAVLREKLKTYASTDSEAIWNKTLQKIDSGAKIDGGAKLVDLYPEKKTFRIPYGKVAAAASIILLITAGTWYYFGKTPTNSTAKTAPKVVNKNEIVPGSDKATLTLANGSKISLDSVSNGNLAEQGHMLVSKAKDRLVYNKRAENEAVGTEKDIYNTVTTPRGGEYQITLPDGSKVWLNAASSLRFPIAFAGNERIVELTGEAYFEVNPQELHGTMDNHAGQNGKIAKTPFIVKINTPGGNKNEVEVLGTHFNVMAYTEEGAIKTTLAEGKVRVTSGNDVQTIHPGEQAKLREGKISILHVDADDIIGWTNGFISAGGADIDYTMRQIARWYDVSIEYEGVRPNISFEGKLPRKAKIQDIIRILNTNNVKARLNEKDRKIIVTS